MSEIDGVLDDVDLGVEIGDDVDRGVGDDERIGMAGHVHDEAVADPALRPNSALPRDNGAHELVGVQAALHQRLDPARRDEPDRLSRRIVAMRRRDELERADIEPGVSRRVSNALWRADQDRIDEPELVCLDRAAKRDIVAGVRDGHFDSRRLLGRGDQSLVLVAASRPVSL